MNPAAAAERPESSAVVVSKTAAGTAAACAYASGC